MLKIKENANKKYKVDYVLEDGTELYETDWNGEIYGNGWKDEKDTNRTYKPIYKEIAEDEYKIVGFEE